MNYLIINPRDLVLSEKVTKRTQLHDAIYRLRFTAVGRKLYQERHNKEKFVKRHYFLTLQKQFPKIGHMPSLVPTALRFCSNSLIKILSLSNSHNNIASIQKNRAVRLHPVIVAIPKNGLNDFWFWRVMYQSIQSLTTLQLQVTPGDLDASIARGRVFTQLSLPGSSFWFTEISHSWILLIAKLL